MRTLSSPLAQSFLQQKPSVGRVGGHHFHIVPVVLLARFRSLRISSHPLLETRPLWRAAHHICFLSVWSRKSEQVGGQFSRTESQKYHYLFNCSLLIRIKSLESACTWEEGVTQGHQPQVQSNTRVLLKYG